MTIGSFTQATGILKMCLQPQPMDSSNLLHDGDGSVMADYNDDDNETAPTGMLSMSDE